MNKVVADLAIYDYISGLAEILDMNYQDGELKTLKVRWIVASLCYSGSYLEKEVIDKLYYGEDEIDSDSIYQFNNLNIMSEHKINLLRFIDYKDQLKRTARMINSIEVVK